MNRKGYKVYSDSYLISLSKKQLIDLLRTAEHNYFVTDEALDNSAAAGRKIAEENEKYKIMLECKSHSVCAYCKYYTEDKQFVKCCKFNPAPTEWDVGGADNGR